MELSFEQQKQFWLDSLRFHDDATMKELTRGKGKIFWAVYPMELAEGTAAATEVYNYVLGRVGIAPAFTLAAPLPAGVLIYATVLQDSVLYVMASDSAEDVSIDLRDGKTGGATESGAAVAACRDRADRTTKQNGDRQLRILSMSGIAAKGISGKDFP